MTGAASGSGTVSQWLEAEGIVPPEGPGSIADVSRVRKLLVAAARGRQALSYAELLGALGHRFTRPKMRALCKTLDAIDVAGAAAGEPPLAVLVVRESDGLPGQGWWNGANERGYGGTWTGTAARTHVDQRQGEAFRYWSNRT